MLINKDGVITNALEKGSSNFESLAQDIRPDIPIRLPSKGVPLTAGSKVCELIYGNKQVATKGKAMKRTTILDFNVDLYREGIVIETIKSRGEYLTFLVESAKNRPNRQRAERELARFKQATAGIDVNSIIWLAAVDNQGVMYTSSAGVLNKADLTLDSILFDNGKNLNDYLTDYKGKFPGASSSVASLNVVRLPELNLDVKLSEVEVKQAISLTGCLLTIRGFHAKGRSSEDVMAEWNMVAQPLLEALPDTVFDSWDMPWAISTFSGLTLNEADRARANVVAPYLCAAAGLFVTSSSNQVGDQLRMITLFKRGSWNFTNNTYTVRYNDSVLVFEPSMNAVISAALAMEEGALDQVALQVLEAAETYGQAMGDGSQWARLLWCEWMGIHGLIGGLSINASS